MTNEVNMARISARVPMSLLAAFVAVAFLHADQKKLTEDQRVEIMRGLMAEYATCVVPLPRSARALDVRSDGSYDEDQWKAIAKQNGPAGRIGDQVQVTHVDIDRDSITLQINGGARAKGGWKDHVSVGMNGGMNPVNGGQPTNAPGGTSITLHFSGPLSDTTSADVKKMLVPVLLFDKQTVTEQYIDTVSPEVKEAIGNKKPIVGMNRDEVILAAGRPLHKTRESKENVEYEDWIYGQPPGKVMFVTFVGPKVVKVKETYAGLGGSIAETPKQ
jgi:hypothetical protein